MTDDPGHVVRRALRDALADLAAESPVLVACSGGPDSVALARAAGVERRASGRPICAVVVDHGLQQGSAGVAETAAQLCREAGLDPVDVVRVVVDTGPGSGGLEAAARDARRAALTEVAERRGCRAILLAHTRDDQAETVLLRLARGSGARTLSAMAPVEGLWRRPLLDLPRAVVHASVEGVVTWSDPHNADPRFARVRVRTSALPALVEALGDDVVDGLARSARLLRDDADALDDLAEQAWLQAGTSGGTVLDVEALEALPRAVRSRVLRRAALASGVPAHALTLAHVDRLEALVSRWRGQGAVDLPGSVAADRAYGRLTFGRVESVDDRRGRAPQQPSAPEE